MLNRYLTEFPFIAILRGITLKEAAPVARVLFDKGFRVIEVPMNSPEPVESIRKIRAALGEDCLIGAGTVTNSDWIPEIAEAGGRIIVMPHADLAVIGAAKVAGLYCLPGMATPTEGFASLAKGADGLKLFPAELLTPPALKSLKAVFPKETLMIPVGGITPETLGGFWSAGAAGFGLGSAIFKPGDTPEIVAGKAAMFVTAWNALIR